MPLKTRSDRGRVSTKRTREAALRLISGEALDLVSRELGVTAATLSRWQGLFLEGGAGIDLEQLLSEVVALGHVLHGSPEDLISVDPRRPKTSEMKSAALKAIYATDSPPIAIFCSITSEKRVREMNAEFLTTWSRHSNRVGTLSSYQFRGTQAVLDTLGTGFLYVFRRADFTPNGNGEYVRTQQSTPLLKIPTTVSDFCYEIGLIDPAILTERVPG